jgi:hypothetical protein
MKDEKWFSEQVRDLFYLIGQDGSFESNDLEVFMKSIYTQGRADQNEADVKAFVVAQHKHHGFIHPDIATDLYGAILAAGPEDK